MAAASGAFGIADLLAGFHAAHPGVEISLLQDESAQLLRSLNDGSLDLALIGVSGPVPAGIERQVIVDDRLMAGVNDEHPWAHRREVALRMLAREPLICVPRGAGMRSALQEGCASLGVEPHIAFEAADPLVLAQLAVRRLGSRSCPSRQRGWSRRCECWPSPDRHCAPGLNSSGAKRGRNPPSLRPRGR
jgi:DNA-binding transcriptional LysR family regulator